MYVPSFSFLLRLMTDSLRQHVGEPSLSMASRMPSPVRLVPIVRMRRGSVPSIALCAKVAQMTPEKHEARSKSMLSESWSGHMTSLIIRVTLYTSRYFVCECTSQSSPRRRLQYLKVHTDCPLHKGVVLSFHPSSVLAAASTIYYRCGWHQGHSLDDNHRTVHAAVDHVGGRGRVLMEVGT